MENPVIVDVKGEWFVNVGAFPFTDPTTKVKFEPQTPTKVVQSDWMKGQPVIQKTEVEEAEAKPKK